MQGKLPDDITWRKNKVGFEPPQQQWMNDTAVQELIKEARKKLVEEKILKSAVADKPIQATSSYVAESYDWRYLMAALYLK